MYGFILWTGLWYDWLDWNASHECMIQSLYYIYYCQRKLTKKTINRVSKNLETTPAELKLAHFSDFQEFRKSKPVELTLAHYSDFQELRSKPVEFK